MAYINQQDDNSQEVDPVTGAPVTINTAGQDVTMTPFNASAPSTTDPNATKGTGFTNIQRYLNANQTGATNLGNQVAGSINDQTNQAQAAVGKVGDLASSSPTADIWNTQEDANAQQAITNANQKAALTANVGGQSQLIRDIAPGTSRGGVNLDQFLMQQGQGYGKVANAAQNAAGLQGDYASKSNQWQNNATTAQALQALQKQAAAGKVTAPVTVTTPSTDQVPNSSDVKANTDTGATTNNPYLGLTPEQVTYLRQLQSKNAAGGSTGGGTGSNVVAPITATGLLNRGAITRTATINNTGGHSASVDVTGGPNDNTPTQGFTIDANGMAVANDTGLSNGAAAGIGKFVSALTGIPGLSLLGSYLNNKYNNNPDNANAAGAYNANNVGTVGSGAVPVSGDNPTAGEAAATANAGNVAPVVQQPITPEQAAAAAAEGMTPGEAAQERAAQEQAAAQQAADQTATETANRQAYAEAVAQAQAEQRAADQAASEQAASEQAAAEKAASEQTTSEQTTSDSESTGGESTGGGGGGGSSSSRVICTHFYQKGEMSREMWKADLEYTFKHLSPTTVRGYQYWAIPYVKLMRKSKLAEDAMRPVAMYRAKELMYQMGKSDKGSMLGKFFRLVFEPACFVIGIFVGEQDWQSLWVKE